MNRLVLLWAGCLLWLGAQWGPASAQCMKWVFRSDVGGPGPQTRHCMTYNPDRQRVVLFTSDDTADLWEYDGVRWDRIFVTGPKPSPRLDSAMAYDRRRHELVLVGGFGRTEQTELADTWTCRFTIGANGIIVGTWTRRADFPDQFGPDPADPDGQSGESGARADHALVYDSEAGLVRLFGGKARITRGAQVQEPFNNENYSNGSGAWDGTNWTQRSWSDRRPYPRPDPDEPTVQGTIEFRDELGRKQMAATFDANRGRTITYGGLRQIYQTRLKPLFAIPVAEAYIESMPHLQYFTGANGFPNPSRNLLFHTANRCGPGDVARVFGAQIVHDLRRDRYVAFGGASVIGGTLLGIEGCPPTFGGIGSTYLSRLLPNSAVFIEWDPRNPTDPGSGINQSLAAFRPGTELPPAPSTRIGHTMAYDEQRGVTVVYGGWNGDLSSLNTLARETWEYAPGLLDFAVQPAALSETCLGESLTLSIVPLAASNPAIQWYQGNSPIASATNRTLVLANLSRASAGTYSCELRDLCGNRVTSRDAVVRVGGPPGITGQPQSVHVCPGETAETQFFFSSDYPATVQWFRVPTDAAGNASTVDGVAVAGADSHLLRFTTMNPIDNGFYRARVVNRCGTAWTQPIQVTAGVWLRATPRDSTNEVCNPLILEIVASGKGPLQYRWRRNGEFMTNSPRITNTAAASLRLAPLHYFDDATYDCIVSDACNSRTTGVARITVNPNPPFLLTDTNGPAGRTAHRMTYDALRGRTVLFGGLVDAQTVADAYRNDTWEYDGLRWTQRFPANAPSSRVNFSLAFDRHRGRVVLFGGATNNTIQGNLHNGETWEYDGTNWTQRFPANSPAPRINAALFYDPVHRVTTLYGGDTTLPNPRAGDLWTWDGTNWTQRVVNGARPLFGGIDGSPVRPQMIWDDSRGYAVMPPTVSNDPGNPARVTWTWDGTQWTAREHVFEGFGITPSQAGGGGGIAYDSFRREIVYWGGDAYDQTSLWRWNGATWRRDEIDERVGFHLDGASTYDDRRFALVQFGGRYTGAQPELRGKLPRTFERILADDPVLLRPMIRLDDPATNRLFLRITAAGAPPLTYEWQRNGVRITETFPYEGTTQATLAVDRILASDAGLYRCVVRNRCGELISSAMTLAGVSGELQGLSAISGPVAGQPGLRLTWPDPASVLQQAPSVNGPWTPVPGATSPYEILPAAPEAFYRLNPGP